MRTQPHIKNRNHHIDKNTTFWWKYNKRKSLNKSLYLWNKSKVERVWYESDLELGEYQNTQITVVSYLIRIIKKTIMYDNTFLLRK